MPMLDSTSILDPFTLRRLLRAHTRHVPHSSCILRLGWVRLPAADRRKLPGHGIIIVQLKDAETGRPTSTWAYTVPQRVWASMCRSRSKGKAYNRLLKAGNFQHERIGVTPMLKDTPIPTSTSDALLSRRDDPPADLKCVRVYPESPGRVGLQIRSSARFRTGTAHYYAIAHASMNRTDAETLRDALNVWLSGQA